jgi:hypothetical protein
MMNLENQYSKFQIPVQNSKFTILNSKIIFESYIAILNFYLLTLS